jgi:hypothetical protein
MTFTLGQKNYTRLIEKFILTFKITVKNLFSVLAYENKLTNRLP